MREREGKNFENWKFTQVATAFFHVHNMKEGKTHRMYTGLRNTIEGMCAHTTLKGGKTGKSSRKKKEQQLQLLKENRSSVATSSPTPAIISARRPS
jgi:hypothetical protein